ncbi:MAG: hypothetical protein JWM11_2155 [Planctomycetaceae bacterium]|nr:hypothetical protein [Planctomycetaceae bacterium]
MLKFQPKQFRRSRRRGVAGMWGIVCLILATAIAATLGRLTLTGNRLVIQEQRRSQCDWLVQAGGSLASSRLQADPKYIGETWKITAEQLGGSDSGEVVIEVAAADPAVADSVRQIRINARFPKESPREVKLTKTLRLTR